MPFATGHFFALSPSSLGVGWLVFGRLVGFTADWQCTSPLLKPWGSPSNHPTLTKLISREFICISSASIKNLISLLATLSMQSDCQLVVWHWETTNMLDALKTGPDLVVPNWPPCPYWVAHSEWVNETVTLPCQLFYDKVDKALIMVLNSFIQRGMGKFEPYQKLELESFRKNVKNCTLYPQTGFHFAFEMGWIRPLNLVKILVDEYHD